MVIDKIVTQVLQVIDGPYRLTHCKFGSDSFIWECKCLYKKSTFLATVITVRLSGPFALACEEHPTREHKHGTLTSYCSRESVCCR